MKRLLGIAMMADGVLQAMGVAGVLSTLGDRSLRDQILAAAHVVVGVALLSAGRSLSASAAAGPIGHVGPSVPRYLLPALLAALILSLFETTWFNWTGAAARAVYTALALVIVFRKTNLPTT